MNTSFCTFVFWSINTTFEAQCQFQKSLFDMHLTIDGPSIVLASTRYYIALNIKGSLIFFHDHKGTGGNKHCLTTSCIGYCAPCISRT